MNLMKKTITLLLTCTLISTLAFSVGIPNDQRDQISDGLNSFAEELLSVVPESTTQQNVWADAYIGKFFPALPPHFGGGITVGGTLINVEGLKSAINALEDATKSLGYSNGLNLPVLSDKFFFPTASVDLRIGGLFLPFDIGICAMMTNPALFSTNYTNPDDIINMSKPREINFFGFNGSIDYMSLGIDIRYCVLEQNLIAPDISIGAGYFFTKGSIGVSGSAKGSFLGSDVGCNTDVNMSFMSHILFLQAEASKSFAIVNVYGGLRGIVSNSTNSWGWSINSTSDVISDSDTGSVSSGNGASDSLEPKSKFDFTKIQPQLYAGVGFNFLVFQTTLGACVDVGSFFRDSGKYLWSGSLSFRARL